MKIGIPVNRQSSPEERHVALARMRILKMEKNGQIWILCRQRARLAENGERVGKKKTQITPKFLV